jgi:DNA polymerase (family 10)
MTNARIADELDLIADLLEFQGANAFRVRAYRNGARVVRDLPEPVEVILQDENRRLTEYEGIGDDLASKIATLSATGTVPMLDQLKAEVPQSVLALLRIPGLGPKKAATLFRELKITTLDELRQACNEHRVRALKGFAAKTEETILAGIDQAATATARMYWAEADVIAQALVAHLKLEPSIEQLELAGSYRRGKETIGDLDLLALAGSPNAAMDRLASFPDLDTVLGRGDTKMSIRLHNGLQVDLRVVPRDAWGAALQYFTGSKDHNVVVRGLAKDRGLKINEYGVFRIVGKGAEAREEYIAGRTEAEVYDAVGLPCFPPEIREARQEFNWAAAGKLPKLIEEVDIRGDLHMHTTESDGQDSLEAMVAAAQSRGLTYIAITDHSKRVSMAHGLDGDRLCQQWKAIDKLNAKLNGFLVLKGVEVDILEKGPLDLPDDVLAEADWVVASVHYGQNQPREQITDRIVGALKNKYVSAIAHPTGRIINRRKPYEVDLAAVYKAASEYGKLLELNSNPARLDLDDIACAAAKQQGIPIVISTDAHSTNGLQVLRYGILQARRAGLTASDVANTRPWPELKKLIGR